MLNKIVVASKNKGKIEEISKIMDKYNIELISLSDLKEAPDVDETGTTFDENARIKAETICKLYSIPVIADDSGLMVDILNGQPGIYSARFAGENKDDKKNNEKLLKLLEGVPLDKRAAMFVTSIALAIPNQPTIIVSGHIDGVIGFGPKGMNGFGYDPLFYIPELDKTMAEISLELKNKISHRAKALEKLANEFENEKLKMLLT